MMIDRYGILYTSLLKKMIKFFQTLLIYCYIYFYIHTYIFFDASMPLEISIHQYAPPFFRFRNITL